MDQIWDPIRRKHVTATPEERVRQWFVSVLNGSAGVPFHMMRTEVGFKSGEKQYRADIVVYDRALQPLMIVECKQPEVDITLEVAGQALRYFSVLKAPYIVLTNGKKTYLYTLKDEGFAPLPSLPSYEQMLCQRQPSF